MPSKLRFKVCYCSGEDPDFPASELNAHTPHTRGWQTPRFCEYPQEIGVQFASVSDIQQLQVLSHQSKIATRIEIFVGTAVEGDPRPAYSRAKFKRMGYVSLDPNERSNFQARELKTVQFNSSGLFLKLVVHKCSVNRLNIYSQVGLIAINVIGSTSSLGPAAAMSAAAVSSVAAGGISPLDDLTFDLNFDPVTAKHIRELYAAKERAIANEDYDAAKSLRDAIEQLKEVGGRIAKLELRKKAAVQAEDYDAAKQIKVEIDRMRHSLGNAPPPQLQVSHDDGSHMHGGEVTRRANRPHTKDPFERAPMSSRHAAHHQSPPQQQQHQQQQQYSPQQQQQQQQRHWQQDGGLRSSFDEQLPSAYSDLRANPIPEGRDVAALIDPDERQIPTLSKQTGAAGGDEEESGGLEGEPTRGGAIGSEPEEISAVNANDASALLQVLDERSVKCLFSKVWGFRDEGISSVVNALPNLGVDKVHVFRSIVAVVKRGLSDKIPQVYYSSLRLLQVFCDAAAKTARAGDIIAVVEPMVATLVAKLQDANMRTNKDTSDVLLALAANKSVGCATVAHQLLKPLKSQSAWRPVLSRLQIIIQLLQDSGMTAESGFTVDSVMTFCVASFDSANGQVRLLAAQLVALVEKVGDKDKVQRFKKNIKPQILEMIEDIGKHPAAAAAH